MKLNIDHLTEPELIELNHKIVERLRLMRQLRSRCASNAVDAQLFLQDPVKSVTFEYPNKGRYKIAMKVVDIFGNDTMKVIEVTL